MPDLQEFSVQRTTPGNINSPRHTIAGKLMDGTNVIADFTGENAIRWPDVLATLSPEQQDQIIADNAVAIINMKAGESGGGG